MASRQGRQNKCESGEAQRMDIQLHWQLPEAASSRGSGSMPPQENFTFIYFKYAI